MKLNNKQTNVSSTEEFALTDTELETVLGGQGWDCMPPYGGGSPNYGGGSPCYGGGSPYYGGGSPYYGGGSSSCGEFAILWNSSYTPNYGSYGPSDSGNIGYSISTTTTTYYTGAPVSGSSCGGGY